MFVRSFIHSFVHSVSLVLNKKIHCNSVIHSFIHLLDLNWLIHSVICFLFFIHSGSFCAEALSFSRQNREPNDLAFNACVVEHCFVVNMELDGGLKEEYQEIRSIFNNGREPNSLTNVVVDPYEELIWVGNQSVRYFRS